MKFISGLVESVRRRGNREWGTEMRYPKRSTTNVENEDAKSNGYRSLGTFDELIYSDLETGLVLEGCIMSSDRYWMFIC
jgi:hypothetical protein